MDSTATEKQNECENALAVRFRELDKRHSTCEDDHWGRERDGFRVVRTVAFSSRAGVMKIGAAHSSTATTVPEISGNRKYRSRTQQSLPVVRSVNRYWLGEAGVRVRSTPPHTQILRDCNSVMLNATLVPQQRCISDAL